MLLRRAAAPNPLHHLPDGVYFHWDRVEPGGGTGDSIQACHIIPWGKWLWRTEWRVSIPATVCWCQGRGTSTAFPPPWRTGRRTSCPCPSPPPSIARSFRQNYLFFITAPPLSDHLPLNILTHHPGSTLHGQSSLWLCPLQATLKIIFLCIFSSHLYLSDCPFWLLFVLNTSLKIGNNGYKRFYQWTTCFSLLTESHIMRHYEFWNSENDWNHSFKASFSVLGD